MFNEEPYSGATRFNPNFNPDLLASPQTWPTSFYHHSNVFRMGHHNGKGIYWGNKTEVSEEFFWDCIEIWILFGPNRIWVQSKHIWSLSFKYILIFFVWVCTLWEKIPKMVYNRCARCNLFNLLTFLTIIYNFDTFNNTLRSQKYSGISKYSEISKY